LSVRRSVGAATRCCVAAATRYCVATAIRCWVAAATHRWVAFFLIQYFKLKTKFFVFLFEKCRFLQTKTKLNVFLLIVIS